MGPKFAFSTIRMGNASSQTPSGEPYRKATPLGLRVYSLFFVCLPFLLYFIPEIATYLDRLSVVGLYVCWFICGSVGLTLSAVWVKFVPIALGWMLAALSWIVVIVLVAGKIL